MQERLSLYYVVEKAKGNYMFQKPLDIVQMGLLKSTVNSYITIYD